MGGCQLFADAKNLEERDGNVEDESCGEDRQIGVEKDGADGGVEVGEIFQERVRDEHHQRNDDEQQCAPKQLV